MISTASAKKVKLPFIMQPQKEPYWCWAAVGASCSLFYDPQSTWTQCSLASACLHNPTCCNAPSVCDKAFSLYDKEKNEGSLVTVKIAHDVINGAIPIDQLLTELDAGRIVAFRFEIDLDHNLPNTNIKTIFHFVVIAGYETSDIINDKHTLVYVYDSLNSYGDPGAPLDEHYLMSYYTFKTKYKCHGVENMGFNDTDKVLQTYLTKPYK